MNNFDLKNKTAIITGGAQGFGLDIAKKFLHFGAEVRIWDNDETELSNVIKKEKNENLKYDVVDVTNFDVVKKTIENLKNSKVESSYFYSNGWHYKAIYSVITGFIFASSTIWNVNMQFLQTFSWLIGAFISFVTYYLLASK